MLTKADAFEIYQTHLDLMSDAIMNCDHGLMMTQVFLPLVVETDDQVIEMRTAQDLQSNLSGLNASLRSMKVDGYFRQAKEARILSDTEIEGLHVTRILSAGLVVRGPFENMARLEFSDGRWGARWIRHHTRYVSWPDTLPESPQMD